MVLMKIFIKLVITIKISILFKKVKLVFILTKKRILNSIANKFIV